MVDEREGRKRLGHGEQRGARPAADVGYRGSLLERVHDGGQVGQQLRDQSLGLHPGGAALYTAGACRPVFVVGEAQAGAEGLGQFRYGRVRGGDRAEGAGEEQRMPLPGRVNLFRSHLGATSSVPAGFGGWPSLEGT